jgi:hypothetical protein
MSNWKIYYTDGSSLADSDLATSGDVTLIPENRRRGVHSIIQPMDLNRTRETIEQYHYLYLIQEDKWMGVGLDGLLDHLCYQWNNLAAMLMGRTDATDGFFKLRQTIRQDTHVIGAISAAEELESRTEAFAESGSVNRDLVLFGEEWGKEAHLMNTRRPYRFQDWTDMARHRQYPNVEETAGPLGEMRGWPN